MDKIHLAALALSECKLGFNELQRLIRACGSTHGVLVNLHPRLLVGLGADQQQALQGFARACRNNTLEQLLQVQLDWLQKHQVQLLLPDDSHYPSLLKQLDEQPPLLFVKGSIAVLNDPQIAMVGSRRASVSGLRLAQEFAGRLAACGITITSGLALGIDGACHRGCLAAGGQTIAVLGSGLAHIYPRRHLDLAHQIVAEGGALVSPWPLWATPLPFRFPVRNRIISGLSLAVLVVEATEKSGSLITARAAVEQNREVFALPSSIHNPNAAGCHQLIREGALLVDRVEQILAELAPVLQHRWPMTAATAATATSVDGGMSPTTTSTTVGLALELVELLNNFGHDPLPVDIIAAQTGLAFAVLGVQLMELELKGLVRHTAMGYERIY